MKAFILLSVVALSSAAPQFEGVKNFFKQFSDSESESEYVSETVPYKTLNKTIDGDLAFEVRQYSSMKWVCTDLTYDMDFAALETEEKEDDSEFAVFQNMRNAFSGKKKKPSSIMFMRLFRYISGVNSERQEIEMTSPVLSKMSPNEDASEMKNRMCFYLDSAAQENTPAPEEDTVYLYTSEPLTVAVMEFGGYAMKDSVWMKKSAQFAKALGDRVNSVDTGSFYTAGYDSPMKFWNRRNEVMFELKN